jgi:hypothetical protein
MTYSHRIRRRIPAPPGRSDKSDPPQVVAPLGPSPRPAGRLPLGGHIGEFVVDGNAAVASSGFERFPLFFESRIKE